MSRSLTLALAAALFAVVAATPSVQPRTDELWYVYYDRGLRALEKSRWSEAIAQLEQALKKSGKSSANARTYGMRFIKYFPSFYLGVAYYNKGDTDRALDYLKREAAGGEIRKSDTHRQQLEVLLSAASGPRADQAALQAAEANRRKELETKLAEGIALFQKGQFANALAVFEAVLSLDPTNAEAKRQKELVQRQALEAELKQVRVAAQPKRPTPARPGGPRPVTPPAPVTPPTPAPVTPAPATPAPVTPAPVTPAPVTPAPVTPAPQLPVVEKVPATPPPKDTAAAPPRPVVVAQPRPQAQPQKPPEQPAPAGGGGAVVPVPVPVTVPVGAAGEKEPEKQPEKAAPVTPAPIAPEPVAPAPVTPAPVAPAPEPALTEAALFEARAWEMIRRGKDLLAKGDYEGALGKFSLVLTLAEDIPTLPSQLIADAKTYRDAADGEIKRGAEARRQAELAAASQAARTPPQVAIITPTNLEEPVKDEIIRFQGAVVDNNGVSSVEVEVNGRRFGNVQAGASTRGVGVVARPASAVAASSQPTENKGTIVNFSHDVHLTQPVNKVVIRARNIYGLTTEQVAEVKLEVKRPKVWAAIIGIGDYQHQNVPDLDFTVADAEGFYDYLINDLAIPKENVFKLINGEATTQQIKTVLGTKLRQKAAPEDMVIIYYAGHGAPEQDAANLDGDGLEKYLLSWEADPENLYGSAFSMNEIANIFSRIQSERVVFIADACYSGASGGRTVFSSGMRLRGNEIKDNFLARLSGSGKGRVILSASSANEPSQERSDLGHGVFTYYLLEGLKGAADGNRDGVITVDEVYEYVADKVPAETGQTQHPVRKGEVEGEIILGRARTT
ncbi:MAG: caspase family protein [Gemmatimonadetes bacterium]|nr:caspase family protein [Gemmatimonadota bacterium]